MMRAAQAAAALGARLAGPDAEFTGVSTDSRGLKAGDLFVALKGERHDGHAYAAQAAAAGAAALLVERAEDALPLPQIVVDDTTAALGALAAHWRAQFDIPLVALTGSSGKTTVKEMLAAILREAAAADCRGGDDRCVLATRGNLNNHIGVPLTLLRLRSGQRYAVIEMGMNHAGEIAMLSRLAAPDVALINNAGTAHIEHLGSVEAIARAKGEIFEGLRAGGTAVFNADDDHAPLWRELAGARRRVEFGLDAPAPVSARYELRELESEIVIETPLGRAGATLPAPGLHNVRNAVAAAAAASARAVAPQAVAAGLTHFGGVAGRLQRRTAASGATVVDDTYNANPDSVRAAIDVLARVPGDRLLVLGDMGELGAAGAALHAQVGEYARAAGLSRLWTVGALAAQAAAAFGAGANHFGSVEELGDALQAVAAPGLTVLVKGSRFMRMERVVGALTGETAQAEAH